MKPIKLTIVMDKDYQNCYWANSKKEVLEASRAATANFSAAFPEVSFAIAKQVIPWESGLPKFRDFPLPYVMEMPRTTFRKAFTEFVEQLDRIRFHESRSLYGMLNFEQFVKELTAKTKSRQFWSLMVTFHGLLISEILYRARMDFPANHSREIVLAFTGKLFVLESDGCAGVSKFEGNHMAIGVQLRTELSHIILHELGHLFGAEHPRDEKARSVMASGNDSYSHFDKKNAKRIKACLKKKEIIYGADRIQTG